MLYFFTSKNFIKNIQQNIYIYIYNIVVTVVLQMGYTLYIIKIIVSIMNHYKNIIVIDNN